MVWGFNGGSGEERRVCYGGAAKNEGEMDLIRTCEAEDRRAFLRLVTTTMVARWWLAGEVEAKVVWVVWRRLATEGLLLAVDRRWFVVVARWSEVGVWASDELCLGLTMVDEQKTTVEWEGCVWGGGSARWCGCSWRQWKVEMVEEGFHEGFEKVMV